MPLEIKEVVIRSKVEGSKQSTPSNRPNNQENSSDIVATCVEEVMRILQRDKER